MRDEVVILGLYKPSLAGWSANKIAAAGEVWTLNDWYWVYPTVHPKRIYQCHKPPYVHPDPARYPGDWKAEYNREVLGGAEVWSIWPIPGVHGQHQIPHREVEAAFPVEALSCQVCLMIAHAVLEGRKRIQLLGVTLSADEYRYQAAGIIRISDIAAGAGVEILNPHREEWERRGPTVDWSKMEGGLKPYWCR